MKLLTPVTAIALLNNLHPVIATYGANKNQAITAIYGTRNKDSNPYGYNKKTSAYNIKPKKFNIMPQGYKPKSKTHSKKYHSKKSCSKTNAKPHGYKPKSKTHSKKYHSKKSSKTNGKPQGYKPKSKTHKKSAKSKPKYPKTKPTVVDKQPSAETFPEAVDDGTDAVYSGGVKLAISAISGLAILFAL